MRVRFLRWRLGFRQFSFRPITRVSQGHTVNAFQCLPLFRHAVFPSGFRLQVGRMTQKSSSELLLTASRIQHRVPRRPSRLIRLLSPDRTGRFAPARLRFIEVPPHRWVDPTTKRGDWAPSLHAHYRHFVATTSPSAPVPRIGTLALGGPHLGFSLRIEATGSQVPCSSQDRTRATFMPDATLAVSGSPQRSSRSNDSKPRF